jgi:UDP-2-acetamido-2,6-beta-L-arabino-hexul-4-ose reductase
LEKLEGFKEDYFSAGIIPDLNDPFDRNLFNTFFVMPTMILFFPFHSNKNTDDRGSFVEILKSNSRGQFSFSTTKPGITRGNHFHTRKASVLL